MSSDLVSISVTLRGKNGQVKTAQFDGRGKAKPGHHAADVANILAETKFSGPPQKKQAEAGRSTRSHSGTSTTFPFGAGAAQSQSSMAPAASPQSPGVSANDDVDDLEDDDVPDWDG